MKAMKKFILSPGAFVLFSGLSGCFGGNTRSGSTNAALDNDGTAATTTASTRSRVTTGTGTTTTSGTTPKTSNPTPTPSPSPSITGPAEDSVDFVTAKVGLSAAAPEIVLNIGDFMLAEEAANVTIQSITADLAGTNHDLVIADLSADKSLAAATVKLKLKNGTSTSINVDSTLTGSINVAFSSGTTRAWPFKVDILKPYTTPSVLGDGKIQTMVDAIPTDSHQRLRTIPNPAKKTQQFPALVDMNHIGEATVDGKGLMTSAQVVAFQNGTRTFMSSEFAAAVGPLYKASGSKELTRSVAIRERKANANYTGENPYIRTMIAARSERTGAVHGFGEQHFVVNEFREVESFENSGLIGSTGTDSVPPGATNVLNFQIYNVAQNRMDVNIDVPFPNNGYYGHSVDRVFLLNKNTSLWLGSLLVSGGVNAQSDGLFFVTFSRTSKTAALKKISGITGFGLRGLKVVALPNEKDAIVAFYGFPNGSSESSGIRVGFARVGIASGEASAVAWLPDFVVYRKDVKTRPDINVKLQVLPNGSLVAAVQTQKFLTSADKKVQWRPTIIHFNAKLQQIMRLEAIDLQNVTADVWTKTWPRIWVREFIPLRDSRVLVDFISEVGTVQTDPRQYDTLSFAAQNQHLRWLSP